MSVSPDNGKDLRTPECEMKKDIYSNIKIEEMKLGVWTMKLATDPGFSPRNYWKNLWEDMPLLRRLALDLLNISPGLFAVYIICQVWQGIEDSISLHLSNNLLKTIEAGLIAGKPNTADIAVAVICRFICTQFIAYAAWYGETIEDLLATCVTRHFELILLKAKLEVDLPTSKAASNNNNVNAQQAWRSLKQILHFYRTLLETASMLVLIMHMSRSTGGPTFAFLCASQPLFSALMTRELWSKVSFGYIHDLRYQKMKSLQTLVSKDKFKQDIISGGLAEWIGKQFRQSHEELGSTSDMHPYNKFHRIGQTATTPLFVKFLGDLPMMFCAINAVMNPTRFSVSSIAILQQSSSTLRYAFIAAFSSATQFRESNATIKSIYNAAVVKNVMIGGNIPYPRLPTEELPSTGANPSKGMAFELKDISFSYIGSKKKTPALDSVNLTIHSGQLVVIVGANGSGKSTLIRILSRLYDPSSGEILIDDLPIAKYRISDLHQATALLSQDSNVYPMSLGENIGLGNPERVADEEMITRAAKMGGSFEFIQKLDQGMQTTLDPYLNMWSQNLYGKPDHPLYKQMEDIEKEIDVSGGERQRLVASRTFMRFESGKVNFVAVDEPSSALDAEGELQLFQNLLAVREGKTMVFVTHRFGHLTKHADLIICMKDGSIAEMGTHAELMGRKGEYAGLYLIQARAFEDDARD